ncbi:MAG: hypothetical protein RDV41_03015, partial [Planctomycetota bacterium]|nr:hypothetical protein [Planctomycetota bacterium]
ETHLANLRRIPEKAFDRMIGPLLDELLKGMELRFGKSTEEERKTEKARMLDVIERARAMSDEEFQLNKTPLAKEILKTHDEFIESVHGFVKIISKVTGGLDKTGTFLLNPRIVPLLEKRIELMKSGGLAPTDLDALTADNAAGAG